MKTSLVLAKYRAIYRHRHLLKDVTGPRVENRRVAPLNCRENAAIAAFPRQYQGLRSLVFVRMSLLLQECSWYIPFLVISPEYSSDVRRSLGSTYLQGITYLLDNPLLGLQVMQI